MGLSGFNRSREMKARATAQAVPEPSQKIELGTDSGDQFSDDELRKIIEQETGQKPHHKLGHEKLVEQFNALNAAADEA